MTDIAGWIALAATTIAAMMTAANLGARVTGWGFVVFTVGAVAWIVVGVTTSQTQLLWSNVFLLVVDLVGVWRWLGHRAKLDDGAKAAEAKSAKARAPDLFSVATIDGHPITGRDGATIGRAVGAMAECESGQIAYVVVREGAIGPAGRLHAIDWRDMGCDFDTRLDADALAALPEVDAKDWPAAAPSMA